jgi:hypothetical protein
MQYRTRQAESFVHEHSLDRPRIASSCSWDVRAVSVPTLIEPSAGPFDAILLDW